MRDSVFVHLYSPCMLLLLLSSANDLVVSGHRTSTSKTGFEIKFIDTLRKNFLNQYVSKPTRARGDDHPHILDLITNESFIENIAMLAPLGKSDHSMLNIDCKLQIDTLIKVKKLTIIRVIMMD